MRAVSLTRLYEDKFLPYNKPTMSPGQYRSIPIPQKPILTQRPPYKSTLPPLLPTPSPPLSTTKNPIKRLTSAEQQRRRDQG